ncbi:unnamed protein product [Closterium sp. NIES-65]|nr:unnamed protein product [Closterium sp. NIES-65]
MPRAPEHVFSLLEMVEALLNLRPAVSHSLMPRRVSCTVCHAVSHDVSHSLMQWVEKQFPGEAGGEVRQHLVGIYVVLCRTEGGEERKGEEDGDGGWGSHGEEDLDPSHRSDASHRSHHGGGGLHNRMVSGNASRGRGILGGLLPKKVSKGHEEGKGETRGKSKAESKEGGGLAGQDVVVRGSPVVHPLTSYVVNFILLYFNECVAPPPCDRHSTLYLGTLLLVYDEGGNHHEGAVRVGAATRHLLAALKANLERKGDAFHDEAMRAVFLMNNCEYIQRKVEE